MTKAILLLDYHVTKNLFWNHGILRQGNATNDKNVIKSLLLFLHFQFLLAFFAYNSILKAAFTRATFLRAIF